METGWTSSGEMEKIPSFVLLVFAPRLSFVVEVDRGVDPLFTTPKFLFLERHVFPDSYLVHPISTN